MLYKDDACVHSLASFIRDERRPWSLQQGQDSHSEEKTRERKDCDFWGRFNEKPRTTPGCPGLTLRTSSTDEGRPHVSAAKVAVTYESAIRDTKPLRNPQPECDLQPISLSQVEERTWSLQLQSDSHMVGCHTQQKALESAVRMRVTLRN